MLMLDLPTQSGCYMNSSLASHGEIFYLREMENGSFVGPDALSRTLCAIDKLCRGLPPREDTPSRIAHETAKRLLCEAQTIDLICAMPSTIEGSEGDLLIHWDIGSKSIVLVCPGTPGKAPQVYREVLSGNKATHSEMGDASPETLSAALAWVLQPQP
jgi:hypothetical protein